MVRAVTQNIIMQCSVWYSAGSFIRRHCCGKVQYKTTEQIIPFNHFLLIFKRRKKKQYTNQATSTSNDRNRWLFFFDWMLDKCADRCEKIPDKELCRKIIATFCVHVRSSALMHTALHWINGKTMKKKKRNQAKISDWINQSVDRKFS